MAGRRAPPLQGLRTWWTTWRLSAVGFVDEEAHHQGVPEFAASSLVVSAETPLLHKPHLSVEGDGSLVVRPYLQSNLVGASLPRPVDAARDQARADPHAPVRVDDRHPDARNTV